MALKDIKVGKVSQTGFGALSAANAVLRNGGGIVVVDEDGAVMLVKEFPEDRINEIVGVYTHDASRDRIALDIKERAQLLDKTERVESYERDLARKGKRRGNLRSTGGHG